MTNQRAIAEVLATYRWSIVFGIGALYVGFVVVASLR